MAARAGLGEPRKLMASRKGGVFTTGMVIQKGNRNLGNSDGVWRTARKMNNDTRFRVTNNTGSFTQGFSSTVGVK